MPEEQSIEVPPRKRSLTNLRRSEPITHERALDAAIRLIHSHFGQKPHARVSIPLNLDDDDVVITDYIEQQLLLEIEHADRSTDASRKESQQTGSATP